MNAALVLSDKIFSDMLSIELKQRGIISESYRNFDEAISYDPDLVFVDEDIYIESIDKIIKRDVVIIGKEEPKNEYDFPYYTRPFRVKEMLDHIVGTIDSISNSKNPRLSALENLRLHSPTHSVAYKGVHISLSKKEFQLLKLLLDNKGQIVTREQAMPIFAGEENSKTNVVDVYINYLRHKVDDRLELKLIKSIRGKGYIINID